MLGKEGMKKTSYCSARNAGVSPPEYKPTPPAGHPHAPHTPPGIHPIHPARFALLSNLTPHSSWPAHATHHNSFPTYYMGKVRDRKKPTLPCLGLLRPRTPCPLLLQYAQTEYSNPILTLSLSHGSAWHQDSTINNPYNACADPMNSFSQTTPRSRSAPRRDISSPSWLTSPNVSPEVAAASGFLYDPGTFGHEDEGKVFISAWSNSISRKFWLFFAPNPSSLQAGLQTKMGNHLARTNREEGQLHALGGVAIHQRLYSP